MAQHLACPIMLDRGEKNMKIIKNLILVTKYNECNTQQGLVSPTFTKSIKLFNHKIFHAGKVIPEWEQVESSPTRARSRNEQRRRCKGWCRGSGRKPSRHTRPGVCTPSWARGSPTPGASCWAAVAATCNTDNGIYIHRLKTSLFLSHLYTLTFYVSNILGRCELAKMFYVQKAIIKF